MQLPGWDRTQADHEETILAEYRRLTLLEWLHTEGRKISWLSLRIGFSRSWIAAILHRKVLMSDQMAALLQAQFGLPLYAPVYPTVDLAVISAYVQSRASAPWNKPWAFRTRRPKAASVAAVSS